MQTRAQRRGAAASSTMSPASTSPPDAAVLLPSLPTELVTRILQHVSQQDLCRLARVDSSWRAASLAATKQLVLTGCTSNRLNTLAPWLSKHEQSLNHLTSLQLGFGSNWQASLPELPCRHLRELQLSFVKSQHARYGYPYIGLPLPKLQACGGTLTKLVLKGFDITYPAGGGVPQLSAVQELELDRCCGFDAAAQLGITNLRALNLRNVPFSSIADLAAFLEQQQQHKLTRLQVDLFLDDIDSDNDPEEEDENLSNLAPHLTASTNLQHLDLRGIHLPPAGWPRLLLEDRTFLPQLRYFGLPELLDGGEEYGLSAAEVQGLVRSCPALEALEVGRFGMQLDFQPALSSLSRLTSLQAAACDDAAALKVVTSITGLQRLYVGHIPWHTKQGCAAFRSLLQCSRLTSLTVVSSNKLGKVCPSRSAVKTLAQLTNLVELDLASAALNDAQLMSLKSLVQLTYLSFCFDALSGVFRQRAAQALRPSTGLLSSEREIKATSGGPGVWEQLRLCMANDG